MKYLLTLIAAMTMATTVQAAPPTDEECSAATTFGMAVFEFRKQGATEDQIIDMMREKKLYSGLPVWAANQAMKVSLDTSEFLLRGTLMAECGKRI